MRTAGSILCIGLALCGLLLIRAASTRPDLARFRTIEAEQAAVYAEEEKTYRWYQCLLLYGDHGRMTPELLHGDITQLTACWHSTTELHCPQQLHF
jgi:hypothetical protein